MWVGVVNLARPAVRLGDGVDLGQQGVEPVALGGIPFAVAGRWRGR